jgi:hypothetical protein
MTGKKTTQNIDVINCKIYGIYNDNQGKEGVVYEKSSCFVDACFDGVRLRCNATSY